MGIETRSSISLILLSIFLLSLSPSQSAITKPKVKFNIFTFLADRPEYSDFLDLLNRTQLAQDMATREQVSVMVVRNDNLGDVMPKQKLDVLQPMLCAHVLLEFIDSSSIQFGNMKFPHQMFTVYQNTGVAQGDQGQVRIYKASTGLWIGSAVKGVRPTVKILKMVRTDHKSHSVFEVSGVIITPGISDDILPPPAAPIEAPTPKKAPKKPGLGPSEDDSDEAAADTPAETPADSPADTPAESPEDDDEDSPADAKSVTDKEKDKDKPAAEESPDSSSPGRLVSVGGAFIGCVLAAVIL